jgi:hypothetical protein
VQKKKKLADSISHAVWDATPTIMAPFRQEQHWIRWAWAVKEQRLDCISSVSKYKSF